MSAVLVTDAPANSPEWHKARRNGIGASEIASVVGLSPYQSAFHLWHVKKGNLPGPADNELFRWGHLLEPIVAQRFEELHPEFAVLDLGIRRHEDRPWQLASVDRVCGGGPDLIPLEIKTTRYGDGWGTDTIPLHVACQVQQQMDVFSAPYAWVAVLIGGSEYREYRIEADPEDQAALRTAGEAFWASLQTDDEPPIDASDSTYQAVRSLNPSIDGAASVPIDTLWAGYSTVKAQRDEADDRLTYFKSQILAAMGTARIATADGIDVMRRQMSSGKTPTPYLKEIA